MTWKSLTHNAPCDKCLVLVRMRINDNDYEYFVATYNPINKSLRCEWGNMMITSYGNTNASYINISEITDG